ncbi:MAG: hypothetical protein JOY71_23345 [Acetobacteraceae bacterium]|nr:hypothetical protein [Acetobacteraceae bacterium]
MRRFVHVIPADTAGNCGYDSAGPFRNVHTALRPGPVRLWRGRPDIYRALADAGRLQCAACAPIRHRACHLGKFPTPCYKAGKFPTGARA